MEKIIITEKQVKNILDKVLMEETSKVSRNEFSRVQFKIEELQNSLNETVRELRKLEDSVPGGLKNVTNKKISEITTNLTNVKTLISTLKSKIYQVKKQNYSQPVEEKKK